LRSFEPKKMLAALSSSAVGLHASGSLPLRARVSSNGRGGPVVNTIAVDSTSEPLPFVSLTNAAGDTAKAYPFGACVTSYVKGGKDALMVRPDAKMDGSKPISGGIPFCFPQFGPGAIQQHGFARNMVWDIAEQTDGDEPTIVFKLSDDEYSRGMWDYAFEATYTVTLGTDSLDTTFKVVNTGDKPFDFTAALHSYWSISGISNIKIAGGFEGASYLNKMVDPPATSLGTSGTIEITEETDAVYQGVSGAVELLDTGADSKLTIKSEGWADTVLWNPYGNEGMGFDSFVCIECAKALEPITVAPSAEWVGKMDVIPAPLPKKVQSWYDTGLRLAAV